MANSIGIIKIYPDSFKANVYSVHPFRMIGLIDVGIIYNTSIERVTLAFLDHLELMVGREEDYGIL